MGSGSGLACDLTLNSALSPELMARYQNQATVRRVLGRSRTIAMVGLSTHRQKASSFVATYLQSHGFKIIPVHPKAKEILGEPAYPTLLDINGEVDIVNIFRPPRECPLYAQQAVAIGAKAFWLQLRLISEDAAAIADGAGLDVVMDRCIKMEHGRYDGTMHFVGLNTGIVTARRARQWLR
ncbi:MAG: CoA-binding protein [Bacteroidota bacterium]|nr:CoA-binding protein [Bacteroidota bacterium]MDE2956865.1 CoA-binding protein [Bacteroidota bacterium]